MNTTNHDTHLLHLRDIDDLCCLALLFAGGGIAGWIYEMLFYRINDGMFVHRGQGLGPWLPIYGFGSVFICIIAEYFRRSKVLVFLVSAAVSGVLESPVGLQHGDLELGKYRRIYLSALYPALRLCRRFPDLYSSACGAGHGGPDPPQSIPDHLSCTCRPVYR